MSFYTDSLHKLRAKTKSADLLISALVWGGNKKGEGCTKTKQYDTMKRTQFFFLFVLNKTLQFIFKVINHFGILIRNENEKPINRNVSGMQAITNIVNWQYCILL